MKCNNLKAYLDGELNLLKSLLMRAHILGCKNCRQNAAEWPSLICGIEQIEDKPVPSGLRNKLVADAMTVAASVRTQSAPAPKRLSAMEVIRLKKAYLVAAFVAVLIITGLLMMPRDKASIALAEMARAMAKVNSIHFTGSEVRDGSNKQNIEVWIEQPSRMRAVVAHHNTLIDDGSKLVWIATRRSGTTATIRPSGSIPGIKTRVSYPELFRGLQGLDLAVKMHQAKVLWSKDKTLANGQQATIIKVHTRYGSALLTIDKESKLLTQWQVFNRKGKLWEEADKIEYNKNIPDSLFKAEIPKGAKVVDQRSR